MAIRPLPEAYQTRSPLRVLGGLLLPPNSVGRRMLNVCLDGLNDICACHAESLDHDAIHDGHLANAERLTLVGIRRRQQGQPIELGRLQAILREIKAAQAADEREDASLEPIGCIGRRLAGAICKLFVARRRSTKGGAR